MIVRLYELPRVVAVIPTLGLRREDLLRCIASLQDQSADVPVGVLCVINSADDDVAGYLPSTVDVVVAGINLGWAGALSFARSLISAEFLWLVQDDMLADGRCLAELVAELDGDGALALVSPLALRDGKVLAHSAGGVVGEDGEISYWLPQETVAPEELPVLSEISYVASRGMLVRTSAWDAVGGMDPRYYPVVWADVDFCTALSRAGWRFGIARRAYCWHEQSASTPSPFGLFLLRRNGERFREKWFAGGARDALPHHAIAESLLADVAVSASELCSALVPELVERSGREAELIHRVAEWEEVASLASEQRDRLQTQILDVVLSLEVARQTELSSTARNAELEARVAGLERSTSWRLTAPVRAVGRLLPRNRRGAGGRS